MRARSWVWSLLLVSLLLTVGRETAYAQSGGASLASLEVALWPEYDRPAVLVVYRAELSPDVPLPATVELPIPVAVGEPHAVAQRGADDGLYLADFKRIEVGQDTALIQIATDQRRVQLEYYAPLVASGQARDFTYRWLGGPAIASLTYEVQEPSGAEGLTIEPAPTSRVEGTNGLIHHRGAVGAVAAGAQAAINVHYTRQSRQLSAAPSPAPADSAAPPASPPAGSNVGVAVPPAPPETGAGLALPMAVALLLIVILAVGVQRTYASSGLARVGTRRPVFFGAIGGMLAGVALAAFGVWGIAATDGQVLFGLAVLIVGVVECVVGYYALRKVRPAWAFSLSINGTLFVVFLFGAPKLRDGLDVSGMVSVLPSIYLLAVAIALYASASDYD